MRIVLACLALGVGAIGAVGSLRAAMDRGLATEGAGLLGGDVAIENSGQPLAESLRSWLVTRGGLVSATVRLRSLLVAPSGQRMLVECKAVDDAYPLVGDVTVTPDAPLRADLAGGVVADPLILQRLGLRVGDTVRLGAASFRLAGILTHEPDHAAGLALLGPRVLLATAALPRTGLVQPGSLVTYEWRVKLPPGADPVAFVAAVRQQFPDTGWRLRERTHADPGLDRAIGQTSQFLTLVGLSALLVGGIGVATGVHAWLEGRARTVAVLRCVGAGSRLIFSMFLVQVMGLCALGTAIGVVVGGALPLAGLLLFGQMLPVPAALGIYPGPLALAAVYGLLTAAAFAIWPLGRAVRIPGAALFRDAFVPVAGGGGALRAVNVAIGAVLAWVIFGSAQDHRFALSYCAGAVAMMLAFWLGAFAVMRLAAAAAVRRPVWLRLGLASLYRPASEVKLLMTSLGLGLATLASVALIAGNVRLQLGATLPAKTPSYFFIDIQNDQLGRFAQIVRAQQGASDLHEVPSLRARIVALNGVPVERVHVAPDSRWGLAGDRGLSYSATIPPGSTLAAGRWWPADYAGPPLLSLDAGLAHGWGLKVGDTLRANVLGRNIDFRIASLRDVDWRGLNLNFTLVTSPGLLEHVPHMHIATVRTTDASGAALLGAVSDALPNVTGIRVADVIQAVADILGKLSAALTAAGGITLVSGGLVLAGAVAAGQRRRINEAVIFRTLGGTTAQIRAAWLVEFGVIGATAGLVAAVLGTLAGWAVMRFVLDAPWVFLPGVLAATLFGCVGGMLVCGYVGTALALRARPAVLLRNL